MEYVLFGPVILNIKSIIGIVISSNLMFAGTYPCLITSRNVERWHSGSLLTAMSLMIVVPELFTVHLHLVRMTIVFVCNLA